MQKAKVSETASGGYNVPVNVSQDPYSDELFKLMTRWAKIEERHRKLYQEHSRAKQNCEDSFLQSKEVRDIDYAPVSV